MKNKEKNSLLKPDFLDLDGDGNKEESMKKASEDKEEMREPKVLGGFIRNLSKMIFKKNPSKAPKSSSLSDKEADKLEEVFQIKQLEDFESEAALQSEMSDIANNLKDRGFNNERIEELLEEAYELQNYSELELALQEPIRKPKAEGDMVKLMKEEKAKRDMFEEGGEMKMIPDEQMEEQFVDFVIDEALSDKEESMLMEQLEANPELSMIFDKVIEKASEFTGAGEVEGPGTGVSDSIPARLSDGEFVFTAKSVEQIGADNLMKMMKDAEAAFDSAGKDRKAMEHGGPHSAMDDDNMSNMPKQVEVTYNVNRPESVSTVNPLLARDEEEDLISQQLKEGMLSRPDNIYS